MAHVQKIVCIMVQELLEGEPMTQIQSFPYLFDSFSRWVGSPHQTKINSFQELQHFMSINNGINPCFTTINSFQNNNTIVRTIFNDFDAEFILTCKICGEKLKDSDTVHCICGNSTQFEKEPEELRQKKVVAKIKQAQRLAQIYEDYHLPWVPHFTAKKGVHIFPLFHPEKFQDSDLITNLFYYFIDQAKCYDIQEIKTCKICDRIVDGDTCCGNKLFKIQKFKIPHPDTVVVGDLKRLCRLPGCKRSNGLYCIAVPPEKFLNMEPLELYEMAKTPTQSIMVREPTMKMSEFKFKKVDLDQFSANKTSHDYTVDSTISSLSDDIKFILENMFPLHLCLRTKLPTLEPRDEIRYGAVVHLRNIGMSSSDIITFFSRLGWRDFDFQKTSNRVKNIYTNPRCRFSHKKMKIQGLCDRKNCKYFK